MTNLEFLVSDLPSPEAAKRFFQQFTEKNPNAVQKLQRSEGLLSDVLTLASYSPLLATTLIQSAEYVTWLSKERSRTSVAAKAELLESLARFSLTNSQLTSHVLFSRFRRRELLRIFLHDIRRQRTVAEITEEISNLADAILENALRVARQEMDNRYGTPFGVDEKGRKVPADICIVSLGKLGSRELNYASDIDLLFIYSGDGSTTGGGTRDAVTNREYFVKLAETVTQLIGSRTDEGAAYRVDMRLRPHGSVGALALSLDETVRYYLNQARSWEQQVLIRSRSSAGDVGIYKDFFEAVAEVVFKPGRDPQEALGEVHNSKARIDDQVRSAAEFNVKLGPGGIREIEFIAQALQLAHGGHDRWLRVPHTLISISRLADRGLLTEDERSRLSKAYEFLRRLEHVLQMEHGLQTHTLPSDEEKLKILARKMHCSNLAEFKAALKENTGSVHDAFQRVFSSRSDAERIGVIPAARTIASIQPEASESVDHHFSLNLPPQFEFLRTSVGRSILTPERLRVLRHACGVSPKFAEMIASKPWLAEHVAEPPLEGSPQLDYSSEFAAVDTDAEPGTILGDLRVIWSRLMLRIMLDDIWERLPPEEIRRRLTRLAEASMNTAMQAAMRVAERKEMGSNEAAHILALGKLGSGTLDYDSDLDLIIVYREEADVQGLTQSEVHSRTVESFVNFLSGMTRDGNLYRIDLRLRPHGKNGPNVTTIQALLQYIESQASVWELLAYVQMRAIPLTAFGAEGVEAAARTAIEQRAHRIDPSDVKREAFLIRRRLEETHGSRGLDIKFSSGGLLDVYFVVRCLQLLKMDSLEAEVRTTADKLEAFKRDGSLSPGSYDALSDGHRFVSELDHNVRLLLGRHIRFPKANTAVLGTIAQRMKISSVEELSQQLALHRLNIRKVFHEILGA